MKIIKIGRNHRNDIIIDDPLVTRNTHCQIIQDDQCNFTLIDSSTNGTFVNGIQIGRGTKIRLKKTDIVRIGNTLLPWLTYFENGNPPINDFKPTNFLAWAILSTVYFFLPLGIVSIVKASKVDDLWYSGQHDQAKKAAHLARVWFWWSFGIGIGLSIGLFFIKGLFRGLDWLFSVLLLLL